MPPGPARQNSGTVPLPAYHVLESGGYHELERGSGLELGWAGGRGHTYHELEAGDLPNGESFYDDPTLPKFRVSGWGIGVGVASGDVEWAGLLVMYMYV